MADSYVCSGATMKCTMGTSQARLTVLPIRTVYLTGQPMANISDHLSMVNLAPFGRCRSLGFPATAAATAAAHGHLTPMPCMHNTPFPWMGGKTDYIVKGDSALLKSSTCQCIWGGTISLVTDGQTDTGSADLSKTSRDVALYKNNYNAKTSNTISDGSNPSPTSSTNQAYSLTFKPNFESELAELKRYTLKELGEIIPREWHEPFIKAYTKINEKYPEEEAWSVYPEIGYVYNIYRLSTSNEAKSYAETYGWENISSKMPYQIFEIASILPGFLNKIPPKEFWDLYCTYVPLYTHLYEEVTSEDRSVRRDGVAYFMPRDQGLLRREYVAISEFGTYWDRMNYSDWYKAAVFYHEYGHAYDYINDLSKNNDFRALYEDFKTEVNNNNKILERLLKYMWEKRNRFIEENNAPPQSFNDYLSQDEIEKLGAITDCLQAARDNHYFFMMGHDPIYFINRPDHQIAEFIAHMFENYFVGNDLFEAIAPDTYGKMQTLMEKYIEK